MSAHKPDLTSTCQALIDLARPYDSERRTGSDMLRSGYTVFLYACPSCQHTHTVRARTYIGTRAVPGVGGLICGATIQQRSFFELGL